MKVWFFSRLSKYIVLLNFIIIVVSVLAVKPLWAHEIGESYIYLRVYEDKLTGIFHITLGDLNKALGLQTPDAQLAGDNIADRISEVHSYYKQNVHFFDGDNSLPIRFTGLDMMTVSEAHDHPGNYVVIEFSILENSTPPDVIDIEYNVLFNQDPDHIGLLGIEYYWRAGIFNSKLKSPLVFSPENHRQQLSLAKHSLSHGLISVTKLSIQHYFQGIDHILFILALLLPAAMYRKENTWQPVSSFRPALIYVVKIIVLFTVAHIVTLCVVAYGLFSLPSRLVGAVTAISISVAALNIIIPHLRRKIDWVIFLFSLFHGFRLASFLALTGVFSEHKVLSVLGSSLGVAVGVGIVTTIVLPHLYLVRHSVIYSNFIMRYSAIALILFSTCWSIDRGFKIGFLKMLKITFMNMMK